MHQLDFDPEIPLQLFNTHGSEIAPRSDVIGKHLQHDRLAHDFFLSPTAPAGILYEPAPPATPTCPLPHRPNNHNRSGQFIWYINRSIQFVIDRDFFGGPVDGGVALWGAASVGASR